jgi:hypothetical protein
MISTDTGIGLLRLMPGWLGEPPRSRSAVTLSIRYVSDIELSQARQDSAKIGSRSTS